MIPDQLLDYSYVYIPGDTAARLTLLLLHGTGGDEYDLVDLGRAIAPRAHIISLRGNVMEGPFHRFFKRLEEGVFNEEDLTKRANEIESFISAAKVKHGLEGTRVVAIGFSNGANMAAAMLLLKPTVLAGAILWRAMLPLHPATSPHLAGVPVLIVSGVGDRMTGEDKVRALYEVLAGNKARVTHEWIDAGHGLTQKDLTLSAAWLSTNFPSS